MKGQFTTEAEKAIDKAVKFAVKMENPVVGTEHMLYGLSAAPGIASCVLKENGIDKEEIKFEIERASAAVLCAWQSVGRRRSSHRNWKILWWQAGRRRCAVIRKK